jgi:DnaJ-class molecular chaperone
MKLCSSCNGKGIINFEVCDHCDGEGIDPNSTFTVGRANRRKTSVLEFEREEKKVKFDKKNASRNV